MTAKQIDSKQEKAPRLDNRLFVKLEDVRPDPDQPRTHFDKEKLEQLAASIKEQGVIQDLIVVYQPGVKVTAPDLVEKNWQAVEDITGRVVATGSESQVKMFAKGKEQPWYKLVDGERRWKAAMLAGLKEVPVAVRQVNEKSKLALQVVVNQQREALTALEEAAAYQKEIDSKRHTAESLYKALGISRGTLFSRLALTRLHPPVREALERGKISVSVAGLVTMVPDKKQQEALLKELTDEQGYQYPYSFRDAQELIENEWCKQLKKAPFDPKKIYEGEFKDEMGTVMLHLRGACEGCRFRSGNLEGVDCANKQICTQPKCFEAKSQAHWKEKSVLAQSKGLEVIDGAKWEKVKGQYVEEGREEYIGNKYRSWKDAMGGKSKEVPRFLAQTEFGPMEVIRKADAKEAAAKNGVKIHSNSGYSPAEYEKSEAERKARRTLVQKAVDWAKPLVVARIASIKAADAWKLVARWVWDAENYRIKADLRKAYQNGEKWRESEAQQWVIEALYCTSEGTDYNGEVQSSFELICDQVRVDVKARLKEVRAEAKAVAKPVDKSKKDKPPRGGGKTKSQS